jgi:CubicO group peptidase (beta-lactamase class C family)
VVLPATRTVRTRMAEWRVGVLRGRASRASRALAACTALTACASRVASRPSPPQPQAPALSGVAARLDSVVQAYAAAGDLSGAVLVADHGQVVYERAVGEANRELHVPNSVATRFRIASTTKQFTAALVLRLVEQGKLRLDGRIVDYLPDYPRPQGERVTLHQLLSHTAGLPDYPRLPRFYDDRATRAHTTAELVALFDSLPLTHEPGARWDYSNSHYVVLGAVIERVTGESYATALRTRLLEPLGLRETAYDDPLPVVEGRAAGYVRTPDGIVNAPFIDPSVVFAAGMLRSTTHDLLRWAGLLREGRVFRDSASAAAMFKAHADTGLPLGGYGYGVFVGTQTLGGRAVRVVQHGGTIHGFAAGFWRMPDEDRVVVVLDNTMNPKVPALTAALAGVLYDPR